MKKWIKFLKEYSQTVDGNEETFAKDAVLEIESDTADSLVKLGFAEETEKPDTDGVVSKTVSQFTDSVTAVIQKSVASAMDKATEDFNKQIKLPATARDYEEEGKNGFKHEGEFAEAVIKAADPNERVVDERLLKGASEAQGQNTLDDAEGGYLVPETFDNQIWSREGTEVDLFGMAGTKKQTSGNTISFNRWFESSRKDGYRHHGAAAYWTQEAEEFTKSTLKMSRMRMELNKLTALYYATDEEVADASVSFRSIFNENASKVIRWKLNKAMFDGTGAGQPIGVTDAQNGALISIARATASRVKHADVRQMYHRMAPELRGSAVWLAHPNVIEQLERITFDDDTSAAYMPVFLPPGGISSSPYGAIYARPVIPLEFCKDLGTESDFLFVNWAGYATLTKAGGGIRRASSIHVRFLYEETAFRFSFRADAQPLWSSAVTDYEGTTTRSPFIQLTDAA